MDFQLKWYLTISITSFEVCLWIEKKTLYISGEWRKWWQQWLQSRDIEYVLSRGEASSGHRNKISCFRPLDLVPAQFARPPTGALQSDPNSPACTVAVPERRSDSRNSFRLLFAELANPPRRLIQLTRYFGFRKLCRSRLIVLYKQSWCSL